jgi:amidase
LAHVDGKRIFPHPTVALPDRYTGFDGDIASHPAHVRDHRHPIDSFLEIPAGAGVRGLERTQRVDLEDWTDAHGLDALVFPAVADVGPADMDVNEASADLGWRNGVWVARATWRSGTSHPDGHSADGHDG